MGKEKDPLQLSSRRRVYHAVRLNPGVHLRELSRLLNMQIGQLTYHLSYLEKEGLIIKRKEGNHLHFFVSRALTQYEIKIISFLRKESTRAIIILLLEGGQFTLGEIRDKLTMPLKTIIFHLGKLLEEEIIVSFEENKKKDETFAGKMSLKISAEQSIGIKYKLKDSETVRKMLITYQTTLFDHLLDSL